MRHFWVLCLLSAAVALPTAEQLHTNLAVLPPAPELESEEKHDSSNALVVNVPNQTPLDEPESEEAMNPSESAEKPKAEMDEDKNKLDDVINVIQKESKESKESKDSKEKSKESKESKELGELEERPEEPMEEKKENDPKSEESNEGDEEDGPIIVHVIQKPSQKGFSDWLPSFPGLHIPWPLSYIYSKFRNGGERGQPIYIVRETDFTYHDI